jgi:hypothetical protein
MLTMPKPSETAYLFFREVHSISGQGVRCQFLPHPNQATSVNGKRRYIT